MSKSEREQFLAEPRLGIVGIDEPGRPPRIVPIWYDYSPAVGLWILSNEWSRKTALLRKAGTFSVCVQDDTPYAYRHVSVQGPITEIRGCELERDLRPLARRYLGTEKGDAFANERDCSSQLIFVMQPRHWVTADYRDQFPNGAGA